MRAVSSACCNGATRPENAVERDRLRAALVRIRDHAMESRDPPRKVLGAVRNMAIDALTPRRARGRRRA